MLHRLFVVRKKPEATVVERAMIRRRHNSVGENEEETPRCPRNWILFITATVTIQIMQVSIWKSMTMDTNPSLRTLGLEEQRNMGSLVELTSNQHRQPKTCSDVPFDPVALQKAIEANNAFHKFGGNLKSVQQFRDQTIDNTMQRLSLKFVPDGQAEAVPGLMSFLKNYYDMHYDPRGGYGKPLPGQFVRKGQTVDPKKKGRKQDEMPELFGNRWIEPLEEGQGRAKWDASLGPIGPECPKLVQLGNKKRVGYKFYCPSTTEDYISLNDISETPTQTQRTTTEHSTNKASTCHIVSVGGNDNWKFEVAAADSLGCIVHTFDCTLPDNNPRHKPNRDDIRFYPHCLDGTTWKDAHGRSYVSYQDLLLTAGIEKAPSYLKLDVEGFEYDIFQQMIQRDQQQEDRAQSLLPQQIQVELHWATRMTGVEWMPRTRSAGELALLSGMMYLGGGYLPIHLDFNPHCSTCMEVLYYKMIC